MIFSLVFSDKKSSQYYLFTHILSWLLFHFPHDSSSFFPFCGLTGKYIGKQERMENVKPAMSSYKGEKTASGWLRSGGGRAQSRLLYMKGRALRREQRRLREAAAAVTALGYGGDPHRAHPAGLKPRSGTQTEEPAVMRAVSVNLISLLFIYCSLHAPRVTEGCSCALTHPQDAFCNSDIGEFSGKNVFWFVFI